MGVKSVWFVWLAACGFHPAGVDLDAQAIDAPAIDAPDIDPVIDAAIDAPTDAAIDARPPCPAGYAAFNSGRYALRHIAMQHGVAEADCNDDLAGRTHLATWENPASFDADLALLDPGNSAIVFVGAACTGLGCDRVTSWFWNTGPAVAPALWEVGSPNNDTLGRIGVAVRNSGEWKLQNFSALETRPYVCECDP